MTRIVESGLTKNVSIRVLRVTSLRVLLLPVGFLYVIRLSWHLDHNGKCAKQHGQQAEVDCTRIFTAVNGNSFLYYSYI